MHYIIDPFKHWLQGKAKLTILLGILIAFIRKVWSFPTHVMRVLLAIMFIVGRMLCQQHFMTL